MTFRKGLGAVFLVFMFGSSANGVWAAGEPVAGFPNWAERVSHTWINRARVDPQVEMQSCGSNCVEAACYSPVPPLSWSHALGRAARFHADHMARGGFFAHDSNCNLADAIGSLYPQSCDGSPSCACEGSGATSFTSRVGLFGGSASGEIIASPSDPNQAFYLWLYEPGDTSACQFTFRNGHRWLILKSTGSVGTGTGALANTVGDFGSGPALARIPSGAHYPRQAATVEFWANWYDTNAPQSAEVIVDGVARPMQLRRGTPLNGAWMTAVTGLGSGCHRYCFLFRDAAGLNHRYPGDGTYSVGVGASCLDWLSSVKGDMDGDSDGDLVWRNSSTGMNTIWRINANSLEGSLPLAPVTDPNWKIEAAGDLNGDGSADLVWRNYSTGANSVWFLTNGVYHSGAGLIDVPNFSWKIQGAGDLNNDGRADLVWRNYSTGDNAVWYMNGATLLGTAYLPPVSDFAWIIALVNDFNRDGIADLVWRNTTTGRNVIWFMNGTSFTGSRELPGVIDVNWHLAASGDFNGDGNADLVWRNIATGQNVVWHLDSGGLMIGSATLPPVTEFGWEIVGVR